MINCEFVNKNMFSGGLSCSLSCRLSCVCEKGLGQENVWWKSHRNLSMPSFLLRHHLVEQMCRSPFEYKLLLLYYFLPSLTNKSISFPKLSPATTSAGYTTTCLRIDSRTHLHRAQLVPFCHYSRSHLHHM